VNRLEAENLTDLPMVDEYKTAFLDSRKALTEKQLQMLKQNYYAPGHTVTAGELARSVGFANFNAVNVQYGAYAAELCARLGRKPPTTLVGILVMPVLITKASAISIAC
jgi:hypothetical protein